MMREALQATAAWVNSDAVKGMGQWAAVHSYKLDEAWQKQGEPAWAKVTTALASAPAAVAAVGEVLDAARALAEKCSCGCRVRERLGAALRKLDGKDPTK